MVQRRSGVPEADRLAVGWIHGDVLIEIRAAVVSVERQIRRGLILQAVNDGGSRINSGGAIALDDYVRPQAEETGPRRR